MKPVVHFGLGIVAAVLVLSPALSATPSPAPEVRVVRAAFPDELIVEREVHHTRIVEVCDTEVVAELLNEVLRSRAESGDARTDNDTDGSADVSQTATATSGLANVGQITDIIAACSTVNATLTNIVNDSEARSGEAIADNDVGMERSSPPGPPDISTATATWTARDQ